MLSQSSPPGLHLLVICDLRIGEPEIDQDDEAPQEGQILGSHLGAAGGGPSDEGEGADGEGEPEDQVRESRDAYVGGDPHRYSPAGVPKDKAFPRARPWRSTRRAPSNAARGFGT